MNQDSLFETIKSIRFLKGLDEAVLREMAGFGKLVEVSQNDFLFRENELAKDVVLIVSGRISVVICTPKSGCRSVMEIGAGDLVGWAPLVQRNRLSATAWAVTAVSALSFDGHAILDLCERNPAFGYQFMHRTATLLAERLNGTRLQLLDVSGVHMPAAALESD